MSDRLLAAEDRHSSLLKIIHQQSLTLGIPISEHQAPLIPVRLSAHVQLPNQLNPSPSTSTIGGVEFLTNPQKVFSERKFSGKEEYSPPVVNTPPNGSRRLSVYDLPGRFQIPIHPHYDIAGSSLALGVSSRTLLELESIKEQAKPPKKRKHRSNRKEKRSTLKHVLFPK